MDNCFVLVNVTNSSDTSTFTDSEKECFICREVKKKSQEELQKFCDCRDLVVHHHCLLTWIQKGSGNEDRHRCSACTAEYNLQEGTVWKSLLCHWRSLLVLFLTLAAVTTIPFLVHHLRTLTDPPPSQLFKVVAVCSGVIAETLIIKCFIWYCSYQYKQARVTSYSIKARSVVEQRRVGLRSPVSPMSFTSVVHRNETERQTAVLPKDTIGFKLSV
ncbi:uncharacterized protein [Hyperolius riggenbachi]|uniref:uncharacterized protein n=1 Tax=Hyperolius riggenbachi TaxID=752182 RepID=UPI0035A377F0